MGLPKNQAQKYLTLAHGWCRTLSRDTSTQVGAFFVEAQSHAVLARGYNGMPRGVNEDRPERHERPLKYDYFEHAERNAIFNCLRPDLAGSIAVLTEVPSMADMRALASVGVQSVAFESTFSRLPPNWEQVLELAVEAGVAVYRHDRAGWHPAAKPALHPGLSASQSRKLPAFIHLALELAHTLGDGIDNQAVMILHAHDFTVLAEGHAGGLATPDAVPSTYRESAVRNALYHAARPRLRGSSAIVTLIPCLDCARALVAVGVREVIAPTPTGEVLQRWGEHFEQSRSLFDERGIALRELPPPPSSS